jgi:hypothetical protein
VTRGVGGGESERIDSGHSQEQEYPLKSFFLLIFIRNKQREEGRERELAGWVIRIYKGEGRKLMISSR